MIKSAPLLGAVIGSPVSHSLSPCLYNEAFRSRNISGRYEAIECDAVQLSDTLQKLWDEEVQAVSVTMPLKEQIVSVLTDVDAEANALRAVNCLSRGDRGWVGHNTDGDGCCEALTEQGGAVLKGSRAVVLGAGGTAISVALAMVKRGAKVLVINRSTDRAEELVVRVSPFLANGASLALGTPDDIREAQVLVNATSVGMNSSDSPVGSQYLHENLVVLDAVYQPMRTQLLSDAEMAGATTIDGLWMLIQQARRQCVHQFGWKPEAQPLRNAAERELAARRK